MEGHARELGDDEGRGEVVPECLAKFAKCCQRLFITRQPIFRTKVIIIEHLFLISPPPKFLKFLENWKADPTLNSSIPISVAWGVVGSSIVTLR